MQRKKLSRLGFFLQGSLGLLLLGACSPASPSLNGEAAPQNSPPASPLSRILPLLGEDLRPDAEKDGERFLRLLGEALKNEELLVLVDKTHGLPNDYAPGDLVDLSASGVKANRKGLLLRKESAEALAAMSRAAEKDGVTLDVSSSYRSYDYQVEVFKRNVRELGFEEASRQSAQAGTSQHQLGTVIDFGSITEAFGLTKAGLWLKEKAWQYGFSLSFPEGFEKETGYMYEPWHYRYLGLAATELEKFFFKGLQYRLLTFIFDHSDELATLVAEAQAQP